jgi:hypothetical protein
MGKRVLFWGQGLLAPPRGFNGLVRRALNALPHEHLLYGRRAKMLLMELGWDPAQLHVIHNSLDFVRQSALRGTIDHDRLVKVREELFGDATVPVVACPSRLIAMRRLDLLIEVLVQPGGPQVPVLRRPTPPLGFDGGEVGGGGTNAADGGTE